MKAKKKLRKIQQEAYKLHQRIAYLEVENAKLRKEIRIAKGNVELQDLIEALEEAKK